jgi:uncharacterized protein YkwD
MNILTNAGRTRVAALAAAIALLAVPLAGCISGDITGGLFTPGRAEVTLVKVDGRSAAALISRYRAQNGLGPVSVNSRLNALAEKQARAMAAANSMSHNVNGPFRARLDASGYFVRTAGENIAAGYEGFEEVLARWQNSAPHRRNLLMQGATQIGIGKAHAPGTRYKVFWSLIVAAPEG